MSSGGSSGGSSAGGLAAASVSDDGCGYDGVNDYYQPLNIAAVFIILVASVLGTSIPLVAKHYPSMSRYPFVFIWGKHVGTGVLLALGFIHLLAPAFDELGNPCLPAAWSSDYEYAPLFCLLAALAMHFIETIAHQYLDGKAGAGQTPAGPAGPYEAPGSPYRQQNPALGDTPKSPNGSDIELTKQIDYPIKPSSASSSPRHEADAPDCVVIESPTNGSEVVHIHSHKHTGVHTHALAADGHTHGAEETGHTHSILLGNAERTVAAYILEFGLTSHSVIVGITVGVASHSDLKTLIPALVFHQFFEGFALGARLAEVGFSRLNELALMLIYSLSAPIGIAIGIGIATTYNQNSDTANLVEGSFDAISAGIILYVAFVQMLAFEVSCHRFLCCCCAVAHVFSITNRTFVSVFFAFLCGSVYQGLQECGKRPSQADCTVVWTVRGCRHHGLHR